MFARIVKQKQSIIWHDPRQNAIFYDAWSKYQIK